MDLLGYLNCLSLGLIISKSCSFSFISLIDCLLLVVAVDVLTLLILKSFLSGFLIAYDGSMLLLMKSLSFYELGLSLS
jgi:hypothetical protein